MILGIDLSMRSTGMCAVSDTAHIFRLVQNESDVPQLFIDNANDIVKFVYELIDAGHKIERIHLEGLSLRSVSGSGDKIIGNFWYVQTQLYINFPEIPITVVEVLTWRCPLFNKEERKRQKEYTTQVNALQKRMKEEKLSRTERGFLAVENEEIILGANIKHQTLLKLPENIREEIINMNVGTAKYDLTDAWFLANHKGKK